MKIGILGGSGLYDMDGMRKIRRRSVRTPFGAPSDEYVCGEIGGVGVCFLPRHGRGHRILPSEINYRANICGFKSLGVERIISVSAVGSLKESLRPRDIVLPDQYFDRTKNSLQHTFFGGGAVAHVTFADPACADLRAAIRAAAVKIAARKTETRKVRVHAGGVYVNMEGPAFSTKAESRVYRKFGFDIIGMTSLAEAKLCKEAEICYQAMAMVTDYDCWRESEGPVTVQMIIGNLIANTALARDILREVLPRLAAARRCACANSLENAIITDKAVMPAATRRKLRSIAARYL